MNTNEIAVLNGGPVLGDVGSEGGSISTPWGTLPTPGGVPTGLTDFASLATQATQAAQGQTGQAKQLLASAATIALAAAPIPVAGWIVSLGSLVVGAILTALGIRGSTQHVSETQASQESAKFELTQKQVWDSLPQDAKAEMFSRIFDWTNSMGADYADGWNGAARQYGWGPWPADWKRQRLAMPVATWWEMAVSAIHLWFTVIMHSIDAEHVEAEMQDYFFRRFKTDVLEPVNAYMLQKYNATIEQYRQLNPTGSTPPIGTTEGSGTGLLIAGAAIVGLMAMGKK